MSDTEDPLGSLVARSVGGDVKGVRAEELSAEDGIERKRVHFTRDGRVTTALFERSARGTVMEAQLLPFLARKTEHVPRVHSRGIPPPHASLGPWLLLEDLSEAQSACDGDAVDVIRAKIAIERAVAADGPALRALGVPVRTPLDVVRQEGGDASAEEAARELAAWPASLVHGDLTCGRARRVERGIVLTRWSAAHLGCALLDAVCFAADLRGGGRSRDADAVIERYVAECGGPTDEGFLRAAKRMDALLRDAPRR
ncbi:MAG TPA: hypothetical protein VMQ78_04845 [Candidatus Limnocylindria bacterium]|nr:hypothetical protein [Candidatus Limnocylindria bacterium]